MGRSGSDLRTSAIAFLLLLWPVVVQAQGVGLETYHNATYGYSIDYPKSHAIDTQTQPNQQKVRFQGRGMAFMVTASQNSKLKEITNEELINRLKENEAALESALRNAPRDQAELESAEVVEIDQRSALYIQGREVGRNLLVKMIQLKHEDVLYNVVIRVPPRSWEANGEVLRHILASFEITE